MKLMIVASLLLAGMLVSPVLGARDIGEKLPVGYWDDAVDCSALSSEIIYQDRLIVAIGILDARAGVDMSRTGQGVENGQLVAGYLSANNTMGSLLAINISSVNLTGVNITPISKLPLKEQFWIKAAAAEHFAK